MSKKPKKTFKYPILSYDVYDGDTIKVVIDRGFDETKKISVRIKGVDTPEVRTSNALEKETGLLIKTIVDLWMRKMVDPMFHSTDRDKYSGRGVGHLYDLGFEENGIGAMLLHKGLAQPYDGGTKPEWTIEKLTKTHNIADDMLSRGFNADATTT